MKSLSKISFVLTLSLGGCNVLAAYPCPPNSCNVANGCMDGCSNYEIRGSANCTSRDLNVAAEEAVISGAKEAMKSCQNGLFYNSSWRFG